jgi:hypothetical protein
MPDADVFVSHAGRDRAWAEWVAWQLMRAGLSVELDHWDWRAGENFVLRMNEALKSCRVMVALFSEAYLEPVRWTTEEWTGALVLAKRNPEKFVPVRIQDVPLPEILGPVLAPALFGMSPEKARKELLRAIRGPSRPDVEPPFPGLGPPNGSAMDGPRLPGVLPAVWGGVPSRNISFTGRDAMLGQVRWRGV